MKELNQKNENSQSENTHKFPCDQFEIPKYDAYRISNAPTIDGKLDEKEWNLAPRSNNFKDLIPDQKPSMIHKQRYYGMMSISM